VDRELRNLLHKKQEKASIKKGVPTLAEMVEGVPVYREINGLMYNVVKKDNRLWYLGGNASNSLVNITDVAENTPSSVDDNPMLLHATYHENGGSDEIDLTGLSGVPADMSNYAIAMAVALGMP